MVSFTTAVKNGFKKGFDFKGCATRAEFWWWNLFVFLIRLPLAAIFKYTPYTLENPILHALPNICIYTLVVVDIILFLPNLSILIRRLHDVGKSGWICLQLFIPIWNLIVSVKILVLTLQESDSYNHPQTTNKE